MTDETQDITIDGKPWKTFSMEVRWGLFRKEW